MSESNGTARPPSQYRRAVERHRAETSAWRRVQKAQKELRDATAEYNQLRWSDLPEVNRILEAAPATNGLVELVDLYAKIADPVLVAEILEENEAERAELPDGGEPPEDRGPADEEQALDRALRLGEVFARTEALSRYNGRGPGGGGVSDDDILSVLRCWPTHRWLPGCGPGQAWGVTGGDDPKFFFGHSTKIAYPHGPASLEGKKLIAAVRKYLGLRKPKAPKPANVPPPPPGPDPLPTCDPDWHDRNLKPDPALDRLGQLLDGQDPSRGLDRLAEPDQSSLPPWTSEDLDMELGHSLGANNLWAPEDRPAWARLVEEGATNDQIGAALNNLWPRSRRFTGPEQTGGKTGYTNQATGLPGGQYFWLGAFRGVGHKATLSGSQLIDRVRTVLEIPTPTEAQKRAQASFREPIGTKSDHADLYVRSPSSGWTAENFSDAMFVLSTELPSQVFFCFNCHALRPRYVPVCQVCGPVNAVDLTPVQMGVIETPDLPSDTAGQTAKRGRGRPRKAAV